MARPAQFILSRFNGTKDSDIEPYLVQIFASALMEEGYSPKTARKRARECIEIWVKHDVEDGKIWVNFPVPSLSKKSEK